MLFRSIVEGIEQRKCNFTFAKIIACGFAYLWIREIVEYVILYLEYCTIGEYSTGVAPAASAPIFTQFRKRDAVFLRIIMK